MAITDDDLFNTGKGNAWKTTTEFRTTEIQAKPVNVVYTLSHIESLHFKEDASFRQMIKSKLATELAREIIDNNLGYFTHAYSHMDNNMIVRGRCFLLPNDQIFLLVGLKGNDK